MFENYTTDPNYRKMNSFANTSLFKDKNTHEPMKYYMKFSDYIYYSI